jgi:hypothetical protein
MRSILEDPITLELMVRRRGPVCSSLFSQQKKKWRFLRSFSIFLFVADFIYLVRSLPAIIILMFTLISIPPPPLQPPLSSQSY